LIKSSSWNIVFKFKQNLTFSLILFYYGIQSFEFFLMNQKYWSICNVTCGLKKSFKNLRICFGTKGWVHNNAIIMFIFIKQLFNILINNFNVIDIKFIQIALKNLDCLFINFIRKYFLSPIKNCTYWKKSSTGTQICNIFVLQWIKFNYVFEYFVGVFISCKILFQWNFWGCKSIDLANQIHHLFFTHE